MSNNRRQEGRNVQRSHARNGSLSDDRRGAQLPQDHPEDDLPFDSKRRVAGGPHRSSMAVPPCGSRSVGRAPAPLFSVSRVTFVPLSSTRRIWHLMERVMTKAVWTGTVAAAVLVIGVWYLQ